MSGEVCFRFLGGAGAGARLLSGSVVLVLSESVPNRWRPGKKREFAAILVADIVGCPTAKPLNVTVEAARWLQNPQNAALKGDQLFAALQQKSWDPSVKSLAPFRRILHMLDANLEWTEQVGEAYLEYPAAVMGHD